MLCEKDIQGNPINNGLNTYIKCYDGIQIYRIDQSVLMLFSPKQLKRSNVLDKLKNIEIIDFYQTDEETQIKFYEKDLERILKIYNPIVKGRNIKPKNKHSYKRNVKNLDEIV